MLSIGQVGERSKIEDFDPMQPQLAELFKEALPKDPAIQSLQYHDLLGDKRR